MPVVVDDTLDVSTSISLRKYVHEKMKDKFKWKDLGECSWYLGCRVTQDYDKITVDQTAYLTELIEKFEYLGITNANVPANPKVQLDTSKYSTTFPYSEIVGSLIWMLKTRPEIAYAVSMCARHLSAHNETHDKAAMQILGYLKKNPNRGIGYRMNPDPKSSDVAKVSMYADSSWADDIPTRRSTYGYFNLLNDHPLSWRCKLLPNVVYSTMSAEYYSDSEAVREAMFLVQFYEELGIKFTKPILIYGDNKSARDFAKVQKTTQLSKQIDVRCHIIREQRESGTIDVPWIPSEENWADIHTKPLGPNVFMWMRDTVTMIVKP